MINGVGRNHFVTLMIFMNYTAVFWKIGISHTKVHISPGEGGGGVLQYMLYRCMYLSL